MLSDSILKIMGPLATLCSWLAILFVLMINPRDVSRSISHHAALVKRYHMIFAVLMSLGMIGLLGFMVGWLVPHFGLPKLFSVVGSLAVILELLTTWIPLTNGWRYTAHQIFSYGAVILVPILLFMIGRSERFSAAARYLAAVGFVVTLGIIGVFIFSKYQRRNYYLPYQVTFIIVFCVALVGAAFV